MTKDETRKLNVFVVDDEQLVADTLCQILNTFGFNAYCAYRGPQAIHHATSAPFDVLITDVVMTGMTGIEAAFEVWKGSTKLQSPARVRA